MSKVALSGNALGTGTFTIASPNSNTDRTLSLPDASGTILTTATPGVPVNGPAFSAYRSTNQSISASTWTKVQCNTEEFDTNSNYDNATSYRFTPAVAGYYLVTGEINNSASAGYTTSAIAVYKNGALFKRGSTSNVGIGQHISCLVYLNGSTDYVELYTFIAASSAVIDGSIDATYFQAFLARSAT